MDSLFSMALKFIYILILVTKHSKFN